MADIKQLIFITDRQKGVLAALNLKFGRPQNIFYTRHVFANLKAKFPKVELRNQYWRAIRAIDKDTFTAAIKDIQDTDTGAFEWWRKLNPRYWLVHAFDKSIKYDQTTNDMTES